MIPIEVQGGNLPVLRRKRRGPEKEKKKCKKRRVKTQKERNQITAKKYRGWQPCETARKPCGN